MEYSDNPRKIYGRVEIIYSDNEISRDIQPSSNSLALISHPNEVYEPTLVPTIKACTMEGNSIMDGSFQMMDDTVKCGWWSASICNANGVFTTPPWLELSFIQRPIISWIIIGDEKREEYPVDFTVEYKRNGTVVTTQSLRNNNKMFLRITAYETDITSVRLTITKWSRPNAHAKIIKFYDKLSEMYEGDAVQMFELTEEMGNEEGNYNISSDTMMVNLYNEGRKFDKGYLRSLMVLDRKLLPAIGVENNGAIEYTSLGVFYSDEWNISQDSQWVRCSAVDRLMRLQSKTYVGLPLTMDASLYDIAEDILLQQDFKTTEFEISEDLRDVVIPKAYIPKESSWDALQEIANAGLCKVYVDRNDKIIIRSESETDTVSQISINKSNMFSFKSSVSLTEFANRISVEYCDIELDDNLTEAVSVTLNIDPNAVLELTLDYTQDVAYAMIESDNLNISLSNFSSGVNACTVTATNTSGTLQTAKLTVTGYAIQVSTKTLTVQDDDSVRDSGVTEYTHPASDLVQSHEHAEFIARTLLSKMRAGQGVVTNVWRGNPGLQLGDEYHASDRFDEDNTLTCEFNKFTYNGSLRQETRGRKKF